MRFQLDSESFDTTTFYCTAVTGVPDRDRDLPELGSVMVIIEWGGISLFPKPIGSSHPNGLVFVTFTNGHCTSWCVSCGVRQKDPLSIPICPFSDQINTFSDVLRRPWGKQIRE
eukprot:Gb_15151 [translate_table: standard]